jgi:hypothetical protein
VATIFCVDFKDFLCKQLRITLKLDKTIYTCILNLNYLQTSLATLRSSFSPKVISKYIRIRAQLSFHRVLFLGGGGQFIALQ